MPHFFLSHCMYLCTCEYGPFFLLSISIQYQQFSISSSISKESQSAWEPGEATENKTEAERAGEGAEEWLLGKG